jgi:hypothetical protein
MTEMTDAERFFYEHGGYGYDPKTETPEQGRARCARELAAAEERLKSGPYFVDVELDDDQTWDGDVPYDGPLWQALLYSVAGGTSRELIGSLSSIACETSDDPYLRVVAAELALEYVPA